MYEWLASRDNVQPTRIRIVKKRHVNSQISERQAEDKQKCAETKIKQLTS